MTNIISAKLPSLALDFLTSLELRYKLSEEPHFTDDDLLNLSSLFGAVFERALFVFEKYPTFIIYYTSGKTRALIEVPGDNNLCYRIFPHINYCLCLAFKHQVIEKKSQITCKHILAGWLALILKKTVVHDINEEQYLMLLCTMFDLEDK